MISVLSSSDDDYRDDIREPVNDLNKSVPAKTRAGTN